MKISRRYLTGPLDNTTLAAILIIYGITTLAVSIIIGRSWLSFFVAVGIYLIVIIIAVLANNYVRRLRKQNQ